MHTKPTKTTVLVLVGLMLIAFTYLNAISFVQRLPVNLGEVGAAVVFFALLPSFVNDRKLPAGLLLLVALWASFALVVPYSVPSIYGAQKVQQLFTLALLAMVGGLLLLRSEVARRTWLALVVLLGVVIAAAAYLLPGQTTLQDTGRLAVEGGSAISTGRAAGAAAVVLVTVAMTAAGRRRLLALAAAGVLLLVVVNSGSRGPLLAAGIAVLAMALVPVRRRLARYGLLAALAALVYYLLVHASYSTDRFSDAGISGENRLRFWQVAWAQAQAHPLGLGWGGLQPYILGRTYPHNIVLEAAAEAGLIAAALLVATLVVALVAQARAARTSAVEMAMFGLLVFLLVNALVSSDLPGNRGLWVMIGAAFASRLLQHPSTAKEAADRRSRAAEMSTTR